MKHRQTQWILVALILFGLALRLYRLNVPSLRGDEAFTVIHWMREPLSQTLQNIATVDPQPPLAYTLFRLWSLTVGDSEYTARLLPALLNILGIPALYALGKRLWGHQLGLIAAFLWTIHPLQIWHAQDARNYAIWGAFTAVSLWLALRALERQRRVDWGLYILGAALSAYVYYLELFVVAALNIYVLVVYWRQWRLLRTWILSHITLAVILGVWFLQERLLTGSGYGGTTGNTDLSQLFTWFLPELAFGGTRLAALDSLWIVLIPALLVMGLWLVYQNRTGLTRRYVVLFTVLIVIPLAALAVVATRLGVFTPRYVLSVSVPIVLLFSVCVFWLLSQKRVAWLGGLLLLGVGLQSGLNLYQYYFHGDYAKSPQWRELTQYLSTVTDDDDWVTQAAADEAFTFYCLEYRASANCDDKLPANPNQSPEEIQSLLTMRSQNHESIWYVANPPDGWMNASVPLDWLRANMQLGRETQIGTLPARQFVNWTTETINATLTVDFPDAARLLFADDVFQETPDMLTVWLYWQPIAQTETPLKVFVHLMQNGQVITQDDQYPQNGRVSTTSWESATLYRDVYTLPLVNQQPGVYTLIAGLYDPETGERVLTADGADHVVLTEVTLP